MKIDFLAQESHHIEHAEAIWKHIKNKGTFFKRRSDVLPSNRPIAVFGWNDLRVVNNVKRDKIIFGEHGIGLSFFPLHPSYAGYLIGKENVKLLLCPNESVYNAYFSNILGRERDLLPGAEKVIIGVPKMDRWAGKKFRIRRKKPVVAISFHWDGVSHCETRSAKPFYIKELYRLKSFFKIIGHGHPRAMRTEGLEEEYKKQGIEVVKDFNEVIRRADVYVIDCGSTGFEFAFTGKPVVFMNCPFYEASRDKRRYENFRFWEYAGIGPEVNTVNEIPKAVYKSFGKEYNKRRKEAVKAIFTYLDGKCGKRAAKAIERLFNGVKGRNNN